MKVKAETIIRTIVLFFALVNQVMEAQGRGVIPVSDEQLAELISTIITIGASVWAWWKNNSFTADAIDADEYLEGLRRR